VRLGNCAATRTTFNRPQMSESSFSTYAARSGVVHLYDFSVAPLSSLGSLVLNSARQFFSTPQLDHRLPLGALRVRVTGDLGSLNAAEVVLADCLELAFGKG
jgi:hypothetical protein